MRPTLNKNTLKPVLNQARRPRDVENYHPLLGTSLVEDAGVTPIMDPKAELALQAANEADLPTPPPPAPRSNGKRSPREVQLLVQRALLLMRGDRKLVDVADELGVAPTTLTAYLTKHRQKIAIGEIDAQLDQIAAPLAATNLIHGLIAGDKDYTLETLKGRGHLRRHSENKEVGTRELPPLRIEFYVEPGNADPYRNTVTQNGDVTNIVGVGGRAGGNIKWPKPKLIEGEVIDSKPATPRE